MQLPIGIANSVSANFGYDPFDALHFAAHSKFEMIQIYVNREMAGDAKNLKKLGNEFQAQSFDKIYLHAEGGLNGEFLQSEYSDQLFEFADSMRQPNILIHFDENEALEEMLEIVAKIGKKIPLLYVENYFEKPGKANAEKNMRKYQALFTLATSHANNVNLLPVLDIPRFFHENLELEESYALQWCYQMLNYFGNRRIPVLLHLIDANNTNQDHNSFCPVGDGYIPYKEFFAFLKKTKPRIEGIVLEFEDKVNSLKSREKILEFLKD